MTVRRSLALLVARRRSSVRERGMICDVGVWWYRV